MSNLSKLDTLLKDQASSEAPHLPGVYEYARSMAFIENVVAVVSDLKNNTSKIFKGDFAKILGLSDYSQENSIWEKRILSMMSEKEQEDKIVTELRFFHYLRHLGKSKRNYYLMSKLRFNDSKGGCINVLHRMYYIYDAKYDSVTHALCLYGPLTIDFKGKSIVVNSLTGLWEELTSAPDNNILSTRERQVLVLIDAGMKSSDIADRLNISKHTVSRHRQEILAKMQVKNSIEACRLAKSMALI